MKKQILIYVGVFGITLAILFGVLHFGSLQSAPVAKAALVTADTSFSHLIKIEFQKNASQPITGLIIQIFVILVFSRICASILKKIGQPQVVGEMVAGILLGKSVLAFLWPEGFGMLFPDSAMPRLYFLSQIGLIFFMFVVGLDLKINELKGRASAAITISHISIVVPFLLGTLLALGIYKDYGPKNFDFISFALFMGIAMSITAFPVLARILQERNLTNTSLGSMALTCAAVDDVTAWCVLAAVIGIVKAGSFTTGLGVLAASVVYVLLMIKVIRPIAEKVLRPAAVEGFFNRSQFSFVFCIVLGSALIAEVIGIHALFGAFLAGTIMPQSISFRTTLIEKIEDLSAVVLLPVFFAYTGIRTQIGLLNSVDAWIICALIIALAILGKMVGSTIAAKWSGMNWRDSWSLGALMNTRGLMELVVLNIGYDLGILSPTVFAMMVTMALVTTIMTGPMLSFLLPQVTRKP